jgi:hypothetical protein
MISRGAGHTNIYHNFDRVNELEAERRLIQQR